jgi:beta-phosphoglucomutase family hydrolase
MKHNRSLGVIFDLDGVIARTGWAHKQAWFDLAREYGFSMTEDQFYSTFGMQNAQIIPLLLGRPVSRKEMEEMGDWKEQRYRAIVVAQLQAPEGLLDLLGDLKAHDIGRAIGSSAPQGNIDLVLQRLQVTGVFDAVVSGEQVSKGKPAPDTFLLAARKLDVLPEQCVVVEDAVQGVEAGRAAGMKVVAITTTRTREDLKEADLIIDNLAELSAETCRQLVKAV